MFFPEQVKAGDLFLLSAYDSLLTYSLAALWWTSPALMKQWAVIKKSVKLILNPHLFKSSEKVECLYSKCTFRGSLCRSQYVMVNGILCQL